ARNGRTAQERAAAAAQVLEHALEETETPEVRVEEKDDVAVVYVGRRPVIQLGPEDAAANGDASLSVHAAAVTAKIRDAIKAERQRSAIATTVFSFSLVVFSALIAFLLLRKIGELAERFRAWMEEHPEKLPSLKVREIEVVQASAVRGGLEVGVSGAKLVAQLGIAYAWVIIALSLFESTRGYTERLTGFVLTPVSALMGRVASALPLLVLAFITVLVVGVALRFVRLFFGSVSRGETHLGWMPKDLATPTSFLVRFGIVVVSLVIAAPLITGTDDGALSRAGVISLVALGLAATPILASAASGIAVVFGRRISVGDVAVVAGKTGRVRATTMLEVILEDEDGCEIHVPHLLSLIHPMQVLGRSPPVVAELVVSPRGGLAKALDLIVEAAGRVGARPRVDVVSLDADGARVRVAVLTNTTDAKNKLLCTLSEALEQNGIPLGRTGPGSGAA
ncbi:MAG TPA: mechanosensitive ion channel domain-containing protein, partial [Minicystis sp.]|nr:mechanosensitive ion channel domain-containing protein [Minicystis sp.]